MEGSDLSEFSLIDKIKGEFSELVDGEGVLGIGDDCAILPQTSGKDTLVSTDLLVEGAHFILSDQAGEDANEFCGKSAGMNGKDQRVREIGRKGISAYQLGWKSAAVNISDIAGMGGKPIATFLSMAVPERVRSMKFPWLEEFLRGYKDISKKYYVALLGGDTTSSLDKLCINVAVLGECQHGKAIRRSAAKEGDLICVSGNLGDSAAGLKLLLENSHQSENAKSYQKDDIEFNNTEAFEARRRELEYLLNKHYMPEPRVKEGLALAQVEGIGAMMDISDGIASDLKHILEESNNFSLGNHNSTENEAESSMPFIAESNILRCKLLAAEVDVTKLPMSDCMKKVCEEKGWDPMELAVGGGEDYELLFTCRPESDIPIKHYVIGKIINANDLQENSKENNIIVWKGTNNKFSGFKHF